MADLTCRVPSLAQGSKPLTCPACWSSSRSLKVRMRILSPVGHPLCHTGLPVLPGVGAGEPGCCCLKAGVTVLGCLVPEVPLAVSFMACECNRGVSWVAEGMVKSPDRKGDVELICVGSWVWGAMKPVPGCTL